MTIPTNPGTGGPDLQSAVDGSSEHYQGVVTVPSLSYLSAPGVLISPTDVIVNASTSGDSVLLAAQGAGTVIHVISGLLISAGDVTVQFWSNAAGTALSGPLPLTANSGFNMPFCPVGHFRALDNQALVINLSASESVGGWLTCIVE